MSGYKRFITAHFQTWKVILLVNIERNAIAWHSIKKKLFSLLSHWIKRLKFS